jgi:precorrin-6A/cobalt-precorrin-6A reductase
LRSSPLRLLILGGTTEANVLARALVGHAAIAPVLSLAGRTQKPVLPPIPWRIGGFGGIDGLMLYLKESRTDAVIDATHPFASRISANAQAACTRLGLPLAIFTRLPWTAEPEDCWTSVETLEAAALALGPARRRVFVASGRLGLGAFRTAPQHHYLIRTIDPPEPADLPPDHRLILARGPFPLQDEIALLRDQRIDVLVSKNSGGDASFDKILAARALRLPVIMAEPPAHGGATLFIELASILAWIAAQQPAP